MRKKILQMIEEIDQERKALDSIDEKYAFLTGKLSALRELLGR